MKIALDNNLLSVDNYNQIIEIESDLISLDTVIISGKDMKILYLDKFRIIISGVFENIKIGEN